LFLEE